MENNLDNAKKFFNENNFEFFTKEQMNVIGKTMRDYAEQFSKKSDKWDELENKIAKIYSQENESTEEEEGSLLDIGEISALAFGFL